MTIKAAGHECLFLPKFHCELNPIGMVRLLILFSHLQKLKLYKVLGWCNYRYRESPKANFAAAKDKDFEVLDACPPEVIWRFINWSWRFIDTY